MDIREAFNKQPWAARLGRRRKNFELMCQHVAAYPHLNPKIIETGTAWDAGNWEGQGQSTLIWDWLCSLDQDRCNRRFCVLSIDIRKEAVETAQQQTKFIYYEVGNSIQVLSDFGTDELDGDESNSVALLYLDSYDWSPERNLESAAHHLMELTSIYAKLPSGCMIVVDDRAGNMKGKHWMVEAYFDQLGVKPLFKNHQIGWIKP